jgi:hypothetical protein
MSAISGPSQRPPGIEDAEVIPLSKLAESATEIVGSARAARAARAAAEEAGVEHVPVKGTREEILARLSQFEWKPGVADLEKAAAAREAAKFENLTKNEKVGGQVYFSTPAVDLKTAANTEMYKALCEQIRGSNKIHAALYGIDSVPELVEELRAAKARGADIQIVVDQNADGTFTYPETEKLVKEFGPDCFRVESNSKYAIAGYTGDDLMKLTLDNSEKLMPKEKSAPPPKPAPAPPSKKAAQKGKK